MRHFAYLRQTEWNPIFEWVQTVEEAADHINKPHEDYPKYVSMTDFMLRPSPGATETLKKLFLEMGLLASPSTRTILSIHRSVFQDKSFAGKFRMVDVQVGQHIAPHFEDVSLFIERLIQNQPYLKTVEDLVDWYHDFETIHPFQDGNGRTGGILVASMSQIMHPEKGYYAPLQ